MKKTRYSQPLVRLSLVAVLATAAVLPSRALTPDTATKPDARIAEAVQRNDRAAVQALLLKHVSVDSAEGDGTTGLHWAAYNDNLPLAKLLLEAHANVHATTRLEGFTPLLMACANGSAPMIDLLLANGASANDANALGTTPLMLASASGNAAAVLTLLEHGADPNAKEHTHDQTALVFAANLDRADVITVLLAHHADPNLLTRVLPVGRTRGGEAAPATPPEGTEAKKGGRQKPAVAPEDAAASKPATQPIGAGVPKELQPASASSPSDAAKEPLTPTPTSAPTAAAAPEGGRKRGGAAVAAATPADPADAKKITRAERGPTTIGGLTPLLFAARQGATGAVKALLAGGAKVDEVSGSEQTTPLVMAIANGHYDTARALLEGGANPNIVNAMGLAPLFATIDVQWAPHEWSPEPVVAQEQTSYLELMKLLMAHGADPNARLGKKVWSRSLTQDATWSDPAGATAFWRAAQADDVAAMKVLVEGGADPKLPSKNGTTPLMMAAGLGWGLNYSVGAPGQRQAAVEFCISHGGDVNSVDETGYTALHGAAFIGDDSLIKFLASKGAKADRKTKSGDSPADMANGPFAHSIPYPATVALLESLGSPNSHECRSDQCVVAPKEDPKVADAAPAPSKPAAAKPADTKKPTATFVSNPAGNP